MGSKLLPSGLVAGAQNAPLYGAVILNLVEETPAAVVAAIGGDTSYGVPMGFLTDLPTFTVSRETVNITEPIAGLGTRLKGSEQLQSEEGTVEFSFAQMSTDNIKYALPGTVRANWNSATTASLTVGTTNSRVTFRAVTPGVAGGAYTVQVPAGAGGGYVVSASSTALVVTPPASGSTAQGVIDAVNANTTARQYVQAGRPAGADGTGTAPLQATAVALSTGTAGTAGARIGYVLTSQGSWSLADYIRTVHVVWESVATNVAHMARIKNAISMDDFSFQADDGGQMSGVGVTLTATSDESDYVAATGNYAGPFAWLKLDDIP